MPASVRRSSFDNSTVKRTRGRLARPSALTRRQVRAAEEARRPLLNNVCVERCAAVCLLLRLLHARCGRRGANERVEVVLAPELRHLAGAVGHSGRRAEHAADACPELARLHLTAAAPTLRTRDVCAAQACIYPVHVACKIYPAACE